MSSPSRGGGANPKVIVVDPGGARRAPVALTNAGLSLGRVEGNDIVLAHDSVSRRHARIDWNGETATVTDLGSSNGTSVGETRLLAQAAQEWNPADWLNIGPFFIQLEPPEGVVQAGTATIAPVLRLPGPGPAVTTNPVPGLAAAAGVALPAQPPGGMFESGRIRVQLDGNTLTIVPGQPAIVRVTLANTGTLVDHLSVTVEGVPESWVKTPESPSQLNPGAQTIVVLQVGVARIAQNRSGVYPVTIRARSRENPNESGTAVALWTVQPFTAGGMTIAPTRAHGRSSAKYTLAMENGSNAPARYDFAGNDEEGALKFTFEPRSVAMEPASTAEVMLNVGAPRKLIGSAQTRRFTVQPSSPDGGTPPPPVSGELVHNPYIPKWLPPVALAVIVAGVVLAYSLLKTEPKAPTIDEFSLNPTELVVGGQVEVKWTVRNATEVRFDPEVCPNPNPPQGNCFFDANQVGDFEVNLVAINKDSNSEKTRKVTVREREPTDPSVTVAASTDHIIAGQEVTITWVANNFDHLTLMFNGQAAEFGPNDNPGSWTDKPQQTTIYTVEVANQGKTDKRSVKVDVDPAPTATATTTATATATVTATITVTPSPTATASPTATMPAAPTPTAVPVGGSELKPTNSPVVGVSGSGDANVLYAFTASRILRSPDGGKTWTDAGPLQPGDIVVSVNDPNVLYAGQRNDCQGSPSSTPLIRSTDGGASWPDSFPNTQGVRPLLVHAAQSSIVIGDDCNLLFSFDGGRTFDTIQPLGPGYTPTSAATSDQAFSFVAVGLNGNGNASGNGDSAVIVFDMSDPSGSTFNMSPTFFFGSTLDWAGGRLAVATDYGVLISDDNGQTWSQYLRGGLDGVTFDVDPGQALPFFRDPDIGLRDIVVDPTNVNRMWLATNRGVYLTENGGQSWTQIVQQPNVQTLSVSIDNNLLFVASPQSTKVYTLNGG